MKYSSSYNNIASEILRSVYTDLIKLDSVIKNKRKVLDFDINLNNYIDKQIFDRAKHYFRKWFQNKNLYSQSLYSKGLMFKNDEYWILDSIENYKSFVRQSGYPTLRLSMIKRNILEHSWLYNGLNDDFWTAKLYEGVKYNDRRIRFQNLQSNLPKSSIIGLYADGKKLHHGLKIWVKKQLELLKNGIDIELKYTNSRITDLTHFLLQKVDGLIYCPNSKFDELVTIFWLKETNSHIFQSDEIANDYHTYLSCEHNYRWYKITKI